MLFLHCRSTGGGEGRASWKRLMIRARLEGVWPPTLRRFFVAWAGRRRVAEDRGGTNGWRPVRWGGCQEFIGMFLVPVFFSLVQSWASFRVILQRPYNPVADEIMYVTQARYFQVHYLPRYKVQMTYGLYPRFLSLFDFSNVTWFPASIHPQVLAVCAAQALLLSASTALFLFVCYRLIPGSPVRRITSSALMGALLLSPFVVVWPRQILTEAVTLPALLAFVAVCLAYDAGKRFSLVLVVFSACLLVAVRDPMIFFIWIFAILLGVNVLFARTKSRSAAAAVAVALLLPVGLGYSRASLLTYSQSGRYSQALVDVIQFRILPDPERRAFFADRGLVLSPTVMERAGKPASFNNTLFERDDQVSPDFVTYRNWVIANGLRTYAAFLLVHPGYLLQSVFVSPNIPSPNACGFDFPWSFADIFSVAPEAEKGHAIEGVPFPPWLKKILLAPIGWVAAMLYLVIAAARYVRQTFARQRSSALEVVAIAGGASIFVSYHIDACELWRHTVPFALLIYFSMIVRVVDIAKEISHVKSAEAAKRRAPL
jgi:hypothetical protein